MDGSFSPFPRILGHHFGLLGLVVDPTNLVTPSVVREFHSGTPGVFIFRVKGEIEGTDRSVDRVSSTSYL